MKAATDSNISISETKLMTGGQMASQSSTKTENPPISSIFHICQTDALPIIKAIYKTALERRLPHSPECPELQ
jgi:hypothetical protein